MTNKAAIFLELEEDVYVGVNVYENGFLNGVGRLLLEHFNDRDKASHIVNWRKPILLLGETALHVIDYQQITNKPLQSYRDFQDKVKADPQRHLELLHAYSNQNVTVLLDIYTEEYLFANNIEEIKSGVYREISSTDDGLAIVENNADLTDNLPYVYVQSFGSGTWYTFHYNEETQRYDDCRKLEDDVEQVHYFSRDINEFY
ncbi:hypothetical protein ACR56S_11770 [Staphylococcus hominis]|uniref:hypothetical protein n=1 Tax=Staphylococcus hominis TaxID=1290 RepID=UPI003DA00E60